MKKALLILPFLLAVRLGLCQADDVEIIKYPRLERLMTSPDKEVLIINFWATWCKPCVAEMPFIETFASNHREGVQMVFVNLDFAQRIDQVKEMVGEKDIRSEVMLLDEIDYNSWIDKVDASWSGAIPATLFISRNGGRLFHEGELSKEELENIYSSMIKTQ